jgi:hypothetical protein
VITNISECGMDGDSAEYFSEPVQGDLETCKPCKLPLIAPEGERQG